MVKVIFARRRHLGSIFLRLCMWSPWSHCGIVDGETVIEATTGKGVSFTPMEKFKSDHSEWVVVEFPGDPDLAISAARLQFDVPYDWWGVIGIGLHREWAKPDAWFCSELVAYALAKGGKRLFRLNAGRVTPQHLWMLSYPIIESAT